MVLRVTFTRAMRYTTSRAKIRRNVEYPVIHLPAILSSQRCAGRWSINICFDMSEQAVGLDRASAIALCPG